MKPKFDKILNFGKYHMVGRQNRKVEVMYCMHPERFNTAEEAHNFVKEIEISSTFCEDCGCRLPNHFHDCKELDMKVTV